MVDGFSFEPQFDESRSDFFLSDVAVSGEIQKSLFAFLDRVQLSFQIGLHGEFSSLLLGHDGLQVGAGFLDEFGAQGLCVHMFDEGCFDFRDGEVGEFAGAVLSAAADKVLVDVAVAVGDLFIDEATGHTFGLALIAEQHALQIVVVDAVTLSPSGPFGEDVLDSLEEFVGDERVVSSVVDFAFVADHAGVVRVVQDVVEGVDRDRLRWAVR